MNIMIQGTPTEAAQLKAVFCLSAYFVIAGPVTLVTFPSTFVIAVPPPNVGLLKSNPVGIPSYSLVHYFLFRYKIGRAHV